MKLTFTLIALCFYCLLNAQKAGTLDTNFGDSGKVISTTYNGGTYSSLIQPDGKIVVGGSGTYLSSNKLIGGSLLARYNTDGSLDLSFADSGRGVYILGDTTNFIPTIYSTVSQPDGKIVALGQPAQKGNLIGFAVMRFNSDGTADKSFGQEGITVTKISASDIARAMTLLPDGRILVTGDLHNKINDDNRSFIACYTNDGRLDESFGNMGIVTIVLDRAMDINAIVVTADSKIIIGGQYRIDFKNILMRFNDNGTPDLSFGVNGLAGLSFDKTVATGALKSIALTSDQKIITGGWVDLNSGKQAIAISRFTEDGYADSSFGTNACTVTEYEGGNSYCNSIAIQPNGKIVAGGYFSSNQTGVLTITRYSQDGLIDSSFGVSGIQNTSFYGDDVGTSIVIQKDGKIVLSGYSQIDSESKFVVVLARYNGDETKKQIIIQKIKHYIQTHNDAQATALNTISIYPNPAQNILHVEGLSANAKLTVVDFAGNVIVSRELSVVSNGYDLNVASLHAGNYLLKIETNGEVITKQFVKEF